jgi:hypothetical protein
MSDSGNSKCHYGQHVELFITSPGTKPKTVQLEACDFTQPIQLGSFHPVYRQRRPFGRVEV